MKAINILDKDYCDWLKALSLRYRQSQIKAAVKVNTEMLKFYWNLGRDIVTLKAESKWGSKFLGNLSHDLQEANLEARCFSTTNLLYMTNFYNMYCQYFEVTPQVGGAKMHSRNYSPSWGAIVEGYYVNFLGTSQIADRQIQRESTKSGVLYTSNT